MGKRQHQNKIARAKARGCEDFRPIFKVGGPMTNLLENVRKRRTKILVMLAANQMKEQPLENTFVP